MRLTNDLRCWILSGVDTSEFKVAALEAELATGKRESSTEEARASLLKRIIRMTIGFLVLIVGIVLLPLPGPGTLVIALGLIILSRDVRWADRLLTKLRQVTPGIPDEGNDIPRATIAYAVVVSVFAVGASILFFF